jgi:hypothetical protein
LAVYIRRSEKSPARVGPARHGANGALGWGQEKHAGRNECDRQNCSLKQTTA